MAKNCKTPGCSYPVFSKMLCMNHWRAIHGKPIFKHPKLKQTDQQPAKVFKVKIRPVSVQKLDALKKYRTLRDKYFKDHPVCEYPGCGIRDITLHHMRGRVGAFLTDKRYFKSLCAPHHRWVEENPVEAQKMGLSQKRLDK